MRGPHWGGAQFDGIGRAHIDGASIEVGDFLIAHQAWNQHENDFILPPVDVLVAEQVFQNGTRYQSRNAADVLGPGVLQQSPEQVDFAFFQADLVLDLFLPDHRLLNSADVDGVGLRRNVHRDFQRNVAVEMDSWLNIDVYANVQILELRIDQGINSDAANAGLKRPSGHGNARADLQCGLLPIGGANLRVLQQLGIGVAHQQMQRGLRNAHREVCGIDVLKSIERQTVAVRGRSSSNSVAVRAVTIVVIRYCLVWRG